MNGIIEVGSVIHRLIAATVLCQQWRGNQLLAYIGRISDNEIKIAIQRGQQEITLCKPSISKATAVLATNPCRFSRATKDP